MADKTAENLTSDILSSIWKTAITASKTKAGVEAENNPKAIFANNPDLFSTLVATTASLALGAGLMTTEYSEDGELTAKENEQQYRNEAVIGGAKIVGSTITKTASKMAGENNDTSTDDPAMTALNLILKGVVKFAEITANNSEEGQERQALLRDIEESESLSMLSPIFDTKMRDVMASKVRTAAFLRFIEVAQKQGATNLKVIENILKSDKESGRFKDFIIEKLTEKAIEDEWVAAVYVIHDVDILKKIAKKTKDEDVREAANECIEKLEE